MQEKPAKRVSEEQPYVQQVHKGCGGEIVIATRDRCQFRLFCKSCKWGWWVSEPKVSTHVLPDEWEDFRSAAEREADNA